MRQENVMLLEGCAGVEGRVECKEEGAGVARELGGTAEMDWLNW